MSHPTYSVCFLLLVIASACGSRDAANTTLARASQVHEQAVGIFNEAERLADSLQKSQSLATNMPMQNTLDSIQKLLTIWEEELIEVPGSAHQHSEKSGHHAHHKTAPKMTDESMLMYQENSKKAISELHDELEKCKISIHLLNP